VPPAPRRTAALALLAGTLVGLPADAGAADGGASQPVPPHAATAPEAQHAGVPAASTVRPQSEIEPPGAGADGAADPGALASAEDRLQDADPGDLWAAAGAVVSPIEPLWNAQQGAYVASGLARARLNAEMLLVHAYAALAGRGGPEAHPERVEPLVRLLTGPMYVPRLNGRVAPAPRPGHSVTVHAPGFADPGGDVRSMHQALDAVAARALAAAWRARDVVGLSAEARALIQDRVSAVARSPFWRSPSRLLNQINWSADLYAADATVTGDPRLLRTDYRRQLIWFAEHARRPAYAGGSPNLGSGYAFRYLPQRAATHPTNRSDTVEYANITLGALAYLDDARAAGMPQLPARTRQVLRRLTRRVAWGDWTAAGYPNWDSGKSVSRLHLTQYWLLALRGYAAGTEGSASAGYLPAQVPTARWLLRRAVEHYQQRAADGGSVILPASAFGFSGSPLVKNTFDGLTGTARFASTLAEMADRGLASPPGSGVDVAALPASYSHDSDIGRFAVSTPRYSTAFVSPWPTLLVGGLEPARLLDARGRALTGVGGSEDGALGLRISTGGRLIMETQLGRRRSSQSALTVPATRRNAAGLLGAGTTLRGRQQRAHVDLRVSHRVTMTSLRTVYRIRNARSTPVQAELRIPTYGRGSGGSLRVGQRLGPVTLRRTLPITTPAGARFAVRLSGLPSGATGRVVRVAKQIGNPTPGPQLRVRVTLPGDRTTTIERLIQIPAATD
jgi:hypothetical protein